MTLQYLACHPLTRQQLAPPLRVSNVSWTELTNASGEWKADVALPLNSFAAEQVRSAMQTDESVIYVRDSAQGSDFFDGFIVRDAKWDPDKRSYAVTAIGWRSWFYDIFLGPKLDLTGDNVYSWTNKDQLLIAREAATLALAGGTTAGNPPITIGTELSGKNRDLNFVGSEFKYLGEVLDSMAQRAGGFEWAVRPYADPTDQLPRLRLALGYPELGGQISGVSFRRTPKGGNLKLEEPVTDSAASRATRVWAAGNAETLPFAVDSDPGIATGFTLRREKVTKYSSVTERTTLASHARAERLFLSPKTALMKVSVSENLLPVTSYRAGDRIPLVYRDDVYSISLPSVRIVQREVRPANGAGRVIMTLDLSDAELPEVDAGGAV